MPSETINEHYAAVLADLEAKRAEIDTTINNVRRLLNLGADQSANGSSAVAWEKRDQPTEVKFDTFFGMSVPDAVRKYLNIMKRPQLASDISKALLEGGLPTTSSNIGKVVGPTLSRMKAAGDLLPIKGKWGLAEWYAAGARERLEAVAKGAIKQQQKKRPKKAVAKKLVQYPARKSDSTPVLPHQIEQIKILHAQGKSHGEIAKEVGLHHFVVIRLLKSQTEANSSDPKVAATGETAQA